MNLSTKSLPLLAALSLFACSQSSPPPQPQAGAPAATQTVIRIGQVSPLTGGIAHLGKDNENGVRLALEEANAKGIDIGGQKVEFELPDVMHTFRQGHRIMVQVQSSWYPLTDRNPQRFMPINNAKSEDYVKATQRVYRSQQAPSSLTVLTVR